MISSEFHSENNRQSISHNTCRVFKDFELDLDFRHVNSNNIRGKVAFLDVCRHITNSSIFGFVT